MSLAENLKACGYTVQGQPPPVACLYAKAQVEQQINALYEKAGALSAVQSLLKGPAGPVLGEALVGVRNPQAIFAKAQQLAANFSKDPIEQASYKLFYNYGSAGMDMLSSYLQIEPQFATVIDAAKKGFSLYPDIEKWVARTESQGIDTAGIMDLDNIIGRAGAAAQVLAAAFSSDAGKVLGQITSSLQVAVGCAGSVMAGSAAGPWGTAAGAVMCGISMLSHVFSTISGNTQPKGLAVVFVPQQEHAAVIAQDAQRLAVLLRYYYNVPSYAALLGAVANAGGKVRNYPLKGSTDPLPAVGLADLVLLSFALSGGGSAAAPTKGYWKYWGLPLANFAAFEAPVSSLQYHIPSISSIIEGTEKAVADLGSGGPYAAAGRTLLEWINYFAGVTATSLGVPEDTELYPLLNTSLPVRFERTGYNAQTWANSDWFNGDLRQLNNALLISGQNDTRALQAVGLIRLMAAFSYLHLQHFRADPRGLPATTVSTLRAGRDVIAELPVLSFSDAASALRLPISPRATNNGVPTPQAIAASSRKLMSRAEEIEDAAKSGVRVDLAGSAAQQLTFSQAGVISSNLPDIDPRVAAGQIQLYTGPKTSADLYAIPAAGGAGGIILLGAAALLALKFLR